MVSKIRGILNSGKPTIGSWMQLSCSSVAEIMGKAGYDWVAVDLEHGSFSVQILPDIFRALEIGGTIPFARVSHSHPKEIKQALDSGAKGLILPMIETGDQLKKSISWALYPPKGTRGIGYHRANLFGQYFNEYFKFSQEILIVAQIEHVRAVENLDDILSVQGLDAIMVGPYDLSGSMDLTGQFDHPHFKEVMDKISSKSNEHKIPMGLHVVQPEKDRLASAITDGYQFIAYGTDAVFLHHSAKR
ncbi:MAG: 2,4-dihydroxyhept-2-ene-1,7-dioic acid aldolase [Candidatus Cloacimonetes bacterium]|nr:2,4-dihydroxyhept-2-ene-1,7-dioic acid aldolase [Candidatus Cloacimonadota bacterium]